MKICKECKWWDRGFSFNTLTDEVVGYCEHALIKIHYIRCPKLSKKCLAVIPLFTVKKEKDIRLLMTGEEFGCVNFEPKEEV